MRTLGLIGAIWFAVSIPAALFIGRFIAVGADERFAQQAGEQR
jgi:hypothetical protein